MLGVEPTFKEKKKRGEKKLKKSNLTQAFIALKKLKMESLVGKISRNIQVMTKQ